MNPETWTDVDGRTWRFYAPPSNGQIGWLAIPEQVGGPPLEPGQRPPLLKGEAARPSTSSTPTPTPGTPRPPGAASPVSGLGLALAVALLVWWRR